MIAIHLLINSYSAQVGQVFFLQHKTSVAIKVQTRKSLLMHDSTLKHCSYFCATQLFSQETTSKRKFCIWNKCLHLLKCCFSGGKIVLCMLNSFTKQMHNHKYSYHKYNICATNLFINGLFNKYCQIKPDCCLHLWGVINRRQLTANYFHLVNSILRGFD